MTELLSTPAKVSVRLLGLGNEILADDAFGILVAREVQRRFGDAVDVVASSDSGFNLLDNILGATHLLVVDAMVTGKVPPGTIQFYDEEWMRPIPGQSPHFIGLFEMLSLARELDLDAPQHITIVAVEVEDCFTVGGTMLPEVEAAIPMVADWVGRYLETQPA